MKHKSYRPLIIGGALVVLLALALIVIGVVSISRSFTTEPTVSTLQQDIMNIEGVKSAKVDYGHSGAPWNNNLSIWVEPEGKTLEDLIAYTRAIAPVALNGTEDAPDYDVMLSFVDAPVSQETRENVSTDVDRRLYQQVCDELFDGINCMYAITVTKADFEDVAQ